MEINQSGFNPGDDCPPGAVTVETPNIASLMRLVQVDPFSLPAEQQVELVVAWERHSAWIESLKIDALAALAGPGAEYLGSSHEDPVREHGPHDLRELFAVEDAICDEVATAMRVATSTARRRVQVARDATFKLPGTRRLLRDGECSYAHVAVISDECSLLDVGQDHEVEVRALGRVSRQTPAQTRRSVRRAVASVCPEDPAQVLATEFARREVTFSPDGSVMATITATLPVPDAMAIWNALTGCAARDERDGDARTMAHKRADALASWAYAALDDPRMPTMQGKKRLDTQLVISWETLIGMNDDAAEIVGYGPIPAHYARKLAVESDSWRRLVADSVTGHLIDYGTKVYQPPAELREYVIARDRMCQFPGCSAAGWRCDLDHVEPWTGTAAGGQTSATNLITLCRRHHRLKTHNHWKVRILRPDADDDDSDSAAETIIQWESPRGQVHERARLQFHDSCELPSFVESRFAARLAA